MASFAVPMPYPGNIDLKAILRMIPPHPNNPSTTRPAPKIVRRTNMLMSSIFLSGQFRSLDITYNENVIYKHLHSGIRFQGYQFYGPRLDPNPEPSLNLV